jgi:hypothetical protein
MHQNLSFARLIALANLDEQDYVVVQGPALQMAITMAAETVVDLTNAPRFYELRMVSPNNLAIAFSNKVEHLSYLANIYGLLIIDQWMEDQPISIVREASDTDLLNAILSASEPMFDTFDLATMETIRQTLEEFEDTDDKMRLGDFIDDPDVDEAAFGGMPQDFEGSGNG